MEQSKYISQFYPTIYLIIITIIELKRRDPNNQSDLFGVNNILYLNYLQ
jgi:hypothetical protein